MKKAPTAALFSLALFATAAAAAQPPWLADAQAQALALATQAARERAPATARVQAQAGALDPRLQLAPCDRVAAFLPSGARPWGALRVGLRCEAGTTHWQVWLPVVVQVWAPAWVAQAALPAGTTLDAAQFTQAELDWAAGPSPSAPLPVAENPQGRVLGRALAPGQPLRAGDLRTRQWFAAGETVQIVAQGAGYAVGGEGTALSAGLEGQPARVRTASGRIVTAQPVGPQRVSVIF